MSVNDLRQWEAFFFVKSGAYEKYKKKKNAPKILRESLKHLVKKRNA